MAYELRGLSGNQSVAERTGINCVAEELRLHYPTAHR